MGSRSLPLGEGSDLEGRRREVERVVDGGRRAPEATRRMGHER